jgi:hypothetical protein
MRCMCCDVLLLLLLLLCVCVCVCVCVHNNVSDCAGTPACTVIQGEMPRVLAVRMQITCKLCCWSLPLMFRIWRKGARKFDYRDCRGMAASALRYTVAIARLKPTLACISSAKNPSLDQPRCAMMSQSTSGRFCSAATTRIAAFA